MAMCGDRVAIVTGAAGKGMGRSTALTLAREGAKVVVNYRSSAAAAAGIVEHIGSRGGEAVAVQADVFAQEGCRELFDATVRQFGRVDICVISPGAGWHPQGPSKLDVEAALDDARSELAPLYYLMPLVLPGMYERHWGRIAGISLSPALDSPAYAYNVAKGARTWALSLLQRETRKHSVTANVISPGPVDEIADLKTAVELSDHGPAWQNRAAVSPQDIAEGIAFLCSDAGRFLAATELAYV
ncbi:MAG: SDR family oxidoreductase [Planctomycetes bacterium]|nr:SDR family oxidoreductase [Planctomycetota bacterium]